MKIIDERPRDKVPYIDLNFGDLFEINGSFYIKTRTHVDNFAVNLKTGEYLSLGLHELVTPVDGELKIIR